MKIVNISRRIDVVISGVIFIIVIIFIFASIVPEAQNAGNKLNGTGASLGSLFAEQGIFIILLIVGLLLIILNGFLPNSEK